MTTTIPLDAMVRRASRMAEQMFDEEGEIDMFWVIDTPAGIINVLSPIFAKSVTESREHKDAINEAMRELLREHEATRYVRVAEAWTTEKVSSTSELPDDEGTVFVTNVAESPIQILGRRNRSGKLFVGSVVSGPPRDPITGEAETLERVVATAPMRIELLTGPEAEDLVSKIQAEMDWRAKGSGALADHPLRKEMVAIWGSDGRETLFAWRDIIRPPGGKPYLSKLSKIERPEKTEGRWAEDLLPNAAAAAKQ